MKSRTLLSSIVLLFLVFGTFASAADLSTTTMTWVVPTIKSLSVAYGSPCTSSAFFFVESNAQYDNDADANWARAVPQATRVGAGDTNCQSSSQAAMTVTNNGNTVVNVDGNFSAALSGADLNIILKVWQGSTGCGTAGLGGWERPCSVSSTTSAPGTTTCKEFSLFSGVDNEGSRLITSLAVLGATELCYSGDLNGGTGYGATSGDHNKSFQLGILFS
ncbi:MAG: hypothetical protein AABW68_01685 [archaeon]